MYCKSKSTIAFPHIFGIKQKYLTKYVEPVRLTAWHPAASFPSAACPRRYSGCCVFVQQRYHYHPNFQATCHRGPCRGAAHTFPSSITIPCLIRCNSFYYDRLAWSYLVIAEYGQMPLGAAHVPLIIPVLKNWIAHTSSKPCFPQRMFRMFRVLKDIFLRQK